jgi:ribonuclease HI
LTIPYTTLVQRLPAAKQANLLNATLGNSRAPDWLCKLLAKFSQQPSLSCTESIRLSPPASYSRPEPNLICSDRTNAVNMWTDGAHIPDSKLMGAAAIFVNPRNENDILDSVQCRPAPENASALKAELLAIIFGLLHIGRDVIVRIHTDSEIIIKRLRKFQLGLQPRNMIKEDHHDLFALLAKILERNFDTIPAFVKVESKIGQLAILVDEKSKEIRDNIDHPYFDISPEIDPQPDSETAFFLHHKGERIVQYPTKFMRTIHEQINIETVSAYIVKKNPEIHEREVIIPMKTMKAAVMLIDEETRRDRGNYKTATYNINSFSNKLETLDKLQRYSFIIDKSIKCPRCELEDETNEHILKCSETILRYPEILLTASTILEREIDRVWNNNKLAQARYTKPTAPAIWKALGAEDHTVLSSPISRGIITETLVDRFKRQVLIDTEGSSRNARNPPFITEDTICLGTAALTSAIHKEIWIPRTSFIFSENSRLEYEQKQRKWEQDRVDKQKSKDQGSRDKSEKSKRKTTRKRKRNPANSKSSEDIPPASVEVLRTGRKSKKVKKPAIKRMERSIRKNSTAAMSPTPKSKRIKTSHPMITADHPVIKNPRKRKDSMADLQIPPAPKRKRRQEEQKP